MQDDCCVLKIMKTFIKRRLFIIVITAVIFLLCFVILRTYKTEILFLEDVGLDSIFAEKVKTVIYDVDRPDGRMESQDPSEIIAVLNTLKSATFRRARKPRNPVDW